MLTRRIVPWLTAFTWGAVAGLLVSLMGAEPAHCAEPELDPDALTVPVFSVPLSQNERDNTPLLWSATALLAADWLQTRDIARRPDLHELNPILGSEPSLGGVNRYFGGAILGTWAAYHFLPEPWNERIVLGVVVVQSGVVLHNIEAGVRFSW